MPINTSTNEAGVEGPETLKTLPVGELGLGRKILEADGACNIDAIIAQAETGEGIELQVLEQTISQLRTNKRYIASPEDAIKLVSHFGNILAEGVSSRKIMSLIHIVAEFISNRQGYEFGDGDHDHVNEVYANQAILSENVYAALDYSNIEETGSEVEKFSLIQPTQLSTEINAFLSVASTQERKYVQRIAGILNKILGIPGEVINWSLIISTADTFIKSNKK